jgi:hypothetical protein
MVAKRPTEMNEHCGAHAASSATVVARWLTSLRRRRVCGNIAGTEHLFSRR